MEYNQQTPPIEAGEEYHLTIEGKGIKGDPFGKVANFVIFITLNPGQFVQMGDKLDVIITRVTPKQAFAKVVDK